MDQALLYGADDAPVMPTVDMMPKDYRIAELLCTRLCHDLIGPVGAVNNGAEFLREEGGNLQGQVVDLIETSARDAVARLQFYRIAYGKVNDIGEAGLSDLKKVTEQFFRNSKIVLDWPDQCTDSSGVPVSRRLGKLLVNMIVLASGALIRGGTLSIRIECRENWDRIAVAANGKGARMDSELVDVLHGKTDASQLTPKSIQAYITSAIARSLEVEPRIGVQEDMVEIAVVRPSQGEAR